MSGTDTRVVLAVVGAPHGLKGEVRVKTFLADPMDLGAYGPLRTANGREVVVEGVRPIADDMVVARFRGVSDRTTVERFKGMELSVPRSALPPEDDDDTFYHADLIGLMAETPTGDALGRVVAVHDFGAGDVLEVAGAGASKLYPFTKTVVPTIDIAGGRIIIDPPREIEAR